MFLPGVFQNAFVHVQGDVAQERGLVWVQWNVSDRVLEEESSKRDEEVFPSGGEVGGDLYGNYRWVQSGVSGDMVPYFPESRLSCHLQEGS